MAINTVDDIASGLSAKQTSMLYKTFSAPDAAGAFTSGWLATGHPVAGAAPPAYTAGSGYTCSSATTGAMNYSNGAIKNWLARFSATCSRAGTLILADRLWSCSGFGFASGSKSVTTPGNLPIRAQDSATTSGIGAELWIEHFVATGTATGSLTATYVNSSGATGRTGTLATVQSAAAAGRFQYVPLQAGDSGIQQLTSVNNSNTWTSGSFGATIIKRIAAINIPIANTGVAMDWAQVGLPTIAADACLFVFCLPDATTAPIWTSTLNIIDK